MTKKTLIISPTFPYPPNTGNRARIYQLLLNLKNLGQEVYLLYIDTEPFDESQVGENSWSTQTFVVPYTPPHKTLVSRILKKVQKKLGMQAGYTYSIDGWYDDSINAFITELANQICFDIVIVEYAFFSKALECFGDQTLKVIDTHDVYTNRHLIYLNNQQPPHWYSTTEADEAKGLDRADVIIAIQHKEKEFFTKITKKKVIVVGHTVQLHEPVQRYLTDKAIVFVGSSTPMNVQGINLFAKHVFPQIKGRFAELKLILAGTICDMVEDFDHCIKLGKAGSLKDIYGQADVVINPITFGTGLKIKTIEALGYAKPLVTTSIGAEGLENGINQAFLVADTTESFVQSVSNVLANSALANELSRNAYEFAKNWNEANLRELKNVFK
ncbi:MAG TPA: glycosyltransferase family 4 protein [Methylococcales bacterium]